LPVGVLSLTNPRKPAVIVRFCKRELDELNEIVQAYGAVIPRSSIVNIAIKQFLHSASEQDFEMCKKRKVNLVIDQDLLLTLTERAKAYGVRRTDLIRQAIRYLTLKYGAEHAIPHQPYHNPS
jgi:metal-responsive CopG/Arc/MetJ family transcriptional regulator